MGGFTSLSQRFVVRAYNKRTRRSLIKVNLPRLTFVPYSVRAVLVLALLYALLASLRTCLPRTGSIVSAGSGPVGRCCVWAGSTKVEK